MSRPGFKTKWVRNYKARPTLTETLQGLQTAEQIRSFLATVDKWPGVSSGTMTKLRKIAHEKLNDLQVEILTEETNHHPN